MLAVVAARTGTKRLPGKNFKPFHGDTLVGIACRQALAIEAVSRVVFSTDAESGTVKLPEGVIWQPRPPELATDKATSPPLARLLWRQHGADRRGLVWLQPTSPLRVQEDIEKCLERWHGGAAVTVGPATAEPHGHDRFLDADETLHDQGPGERVRLNGAVYVLSPDWIKRDNWIEGAQGVLMPPERSVDIDTREDWDEAVRQWTPGESAEEMP